MSLSLTKGGNLSLTKNAGSAGLRHVTIGLGWDERATDGSDFDIDALAFLCNDAGRVRGNSDFVFFNQLQSGCGSVVHQGDNTDGQGDGDDEQIRIDLSQVPSDIKKISICVIIYESESRGQNFGMISNAFVRIVNEADDREMARYDLSEDACLESSLIFADVYRHNGEWKFRAVGQGYSGGLGPLARHFGVQV